MYESIALRLAPLWQMSGDLRSGRAGHTRAVGNHQILRPVLRRLRPVCDIDCWRPLAIRIVLPLVFNIGLFLGYRALGIFLNRKCNSLRSNMGNSHSEESPALTTANFTHHETLSVQLTSGSCEPVDDTDGGSANLPPHRAYNA
jgi:hypothetical protein